MEHILERAQIQVKGLSPDSSPSDDLLPASKALKFASRSSSFRQELLGVFMRSMNHYDLERVLQE